MATMLVSAVYKNTGTSKKNGSAFEIPVCNVLVPRQDRSTPNFQSYGKGLTEVELSVTNECYQQLETEFSAKFRGLPVPMNVETTLDSNGRNVVIAVKAAQADLKAAS